MKILLDRGRVALLPVVALLVFVASGCGGSGGFERVENAVIAFDPEIPNDQYEFSLTQVGVGQTSQFRFEIKNTGDTELVIRDLVWSTDDDQNPIFECVYGEEAHDCSSDAGLPGEVPAGELDQGIAVTIAFTRPEEDEPRDAHLEIVSNSRERPVVRLRFVSGESLARIQLSPSNVEFVDIRRGEQETRHVTLLNTGSADLEIDRFMLDADSYFTVNFDGTDYVTDEGTRSGVLLEPSLILEPNESKQISITYVPESALGGTGTLQLHSNDLTNDGWSTVFIVAREFGPRMDLNPDRVEFGPRVVRRESLLPIQIISRGEEPLIITHFALDPDQSDEDFYLDEQALMPGGEPLSESNPLVLEPNDVHEVMAYYNPSEESPVDETTRAPILDTGLIVIHNNSFDDLVEVEVSGYGVIQDCPEAIITVDEGQEVIPQTTLHLSGRNSWAVHGDVVRWEWSVEQPEGSGGIFLPSPVFPNPTFEANTAGTYLFYLDVWDEEGNKSCYPATYEVAVIPDQAIHVQLTWSTPGNPQEGTADQCQGPGCGSDLDLHFIHPNAPADPSAPDLVGDGQPDPYFCVPYDCYWFNPTPDWGSHGGHAGENPRLDRDDTIGPGPENVNLNSPEQGIKYEVAIHYWNDHGFGPAYANVRIFIYGTLEYERTNVRMVMSDLWSVAYIHWPSAEIDIRSGPGGEDLIYPNYNHPAFVN